MENEAATSGAAVLEDEGESVDGLAAAASVARLDVRADPALAGREDDVEDLNGSVAVERVEAAVPRLGTAAAGLEDNVEAAVDTLVAGGVGVGVVDPLPTTAPAGLDGNVEASLVFRRIFTGFFLGSSVL